MTQVTAWLFDLRTMKHHKESVPLEGIETFRMSVFSGDRTKYYPGAKHLVRDEWDQYSEHVLCYHHGNPVASARVISSVNNRLPFMDNVNYVSHVNSDDTEMGRFLVLSEMRMSRAFISLLIGCAQIYRDKLYANMNLSDVYADVLIEGPSRLNNRTYKRLGFESLYMKYHDPDYGQDCDIYKIPKDDFYKFMDYVSNLYLKYRTSEF